MAERSKSTPTAQLHDDDWRREYFVEVPPSKDLASLKERFAAIFLRTWIPEIPRISVEDESERVLTSFEHWRISHSTITTEPEYIRRAYQEIDYQDLVRIAEENFEEAKKRRLRFNPNVNIREQIKADREVFYWRRVLTILDHNLQPEPILRGEVTSLRPQSSSPEAT